MQSINHDPQQLTVNHNEQNLYEAPAIIYKGTITTRAGTPGEPGGAPGGSGESAVDPADLFGDD
jgi:hypothetical protein